jgi:hypothetical protein
VYVYRHLLALNCLVYSHSTYMGDTSVLLQVTEVCPTTYTLHVVYTHNYLVFPSSSLAILVLLQVTQYSLQTANVICDENPREGYTNKQCKDDEIHIAISKDQRFSLVSAWFHFIENKLTFHLTEGHQLHSFI